MLKSNSSPQWRRVEVVTDTQTSMPSGIPEGAICVQRFDDSLNSAIHITYRISLRSSSMREPRDPLLKVVFEFFITQKVDNKWRFGMYNERGPQEALFLTLHTRWVMDFKVPLNTYCEWSFRRFTYGNLVTTFTSSKWPSLDDFLVPSCCCQLPESNPKASLSHSIGSSDGRCVQRAGT